MSLVEFELAHPVPLGASIIAVMVKLFGKCREPSVILGLSLTVAVGAIDHRSEATNGGTRSSPERGYSAGTYPVTRSSAVCGRHARPDARPEPRFRALSVPS